MTLTFCLRRQRKQTEHIFLKVLIYLYKYINFIYVMSTDKSILTKKKKFRIIRISITVTVCIQQSYQFILDNIQNALLIIYRITFISFLVDNTVIYPGEIFASTAFEIKFFCFRYTEIFFEGFWFLRNPKIKKNRIIFANYPLRP